MIFLDYLFLEYLFLKLFRDFVLKTLLELLWESMGSDSLDSLSNNWLGVLFFNLESSIIL